MNILAVEHKATMDDRVLVKNYRRSYSNPEWGTVTAVEVSLRFGSKVPSVAYEVRLDRKSDTGRVMTLSAGERDVVEVAKATTPTPQ